MTDEQRQIYLSTLKHADTEEQIDLWFYRPIGFRCACVAAKMGITPNAITVVSIVLGVACGVLCYPDDWRWNLLGIVLLVLADIGDSADGQLARMTHQYSRLGRILDGAAGDFWFASIYVAICLRLMPEWGVWIWVLAIVTGACHSQQAAMADYYRQFHLFFAKGKSGSELDDASAVVEEYRNLRLADDPLYKVFMWFYKNYTQGQERMTPAMQRLRSALRAKFGDSPVAPELCEAIRKASKPLMKYTNILTFNCRAIMLFVCLMVGMPWLYFVGELTLFNAILIYMVAKHEGHCRRFCELLNRES